MQSQNCAAEHVGTSPCKHMPLGLCSCCLHLSLFVCFEPPALTVELVRYAGAGISIQQACLQPTLICVAVYVATTSVTVLTPLLHLIWLQLCMSTQPRVCVLKLPNSISLWLFACIIQHSDTVVVSNATYDDGAFMCR